MAWSITLDFDDGNGARDITNYVDTGSFKRSRTLWKELQPTVDYLKFDMLWNSTIMNLFLGLDGADVSVAVQDDGEDYFTGYVRTNWDFSLTTRPQSFKVECVDPGILLTEKVVKPATPTMWEDYTVFNSSNASTSILSQLMIGAGFTHDDIDATSIGDTVDYFTYVEGGRTYWEVISTLLYEYHRTFYFDESGSMKIFDWSPDSISTGDTFDNDNMVGELRLKKNPEKYQQVAVSYWGHKTLSDEIVFSETTDGNQTYKCSITLAADEYYPTGSDSKDVYADYAVEGQDLIAVKDAATNTIMGDSVVEETFTSYFTKAKLKYHNAGSAAEYIYKLDIIGDAIVKGDLNVKEREYVTGTDKKLSYECKHLYTDVAATRLSRALASYYRYSDFTYSLMSGDSMALGDYVSVVETSFLNINNTCVVTGRDDNEVTGKSTYALEGMAEYNAGDTVSDGDGGVSSPFPTQSRDYLVVGASGYAGDADYYCDGTADQTEINAAITRANAAGIGTVHLAGGTFYTSAAVDLASDITLSMNNCTVSRNANDYTIDVSGNSDVTIINGKITRTDSNTQHGIYGVGSGTENITIQNVYVDNHASGITFSSMENGNITGCTIKDCTHGVRVGSDASVRAVNNFIADCVYGVVVYVDGKIEALNNQITRCYEDGIQIGNTGGADYSLIGSNKVWDCGFNNAGYSGIKIETGSENNVVVSNHAYQNGNLIDYSDCEDGSNPPKIDGNTDTDTTGTRDSAQAYRGTYSYKINKDNAAGTGAYYAFTSNVLTTDLHDLVAGQEYKLSMQLYIPSSGGPDASEIDLYIYDYEGSWATTTQAAAATYDAWQEISVTRTLRASATGVIVDINFASTVSADEYIYIDDVRLVPLGLDNSNHTNNFDDNGTDTVTYGNSWQ